MAGAVPNVVQSDDVKKWDQVELRARKRGILPFRSLEYSAPIKNAVKAGFARPERPLCRKDLPTGRQGARERKPGWFSFAHSFGDDRLRPFDKLRVYCYIHHLPKFFVIMGMQGFDSVILVSFRFCSGSQQFPVTHLLQQISAKDVSATFKNAFANFRMPELVPALA